MKHYKAVEFLSIFGMSSSRAQTQSPPIEQFVTTVLARAKAILDGWSRSQNILDGGSGA